MTFFNAKRVRKTLKDIARFGEGGGRITIFARYTRFDTNADVGVQGSNIHRFKNNPSKKKLARLKALVKRDSRRDKADAGIV